MSGKLFSHLPLYSAQCPAEDQSLSWSGTTELREQLLSEISALAQQREELEQVDGRMNFSLQQTCREMIHARKAFYRALGL